MFPLRSKVTTVGRQASGARALWRATGTKENDFGKPIVAIANSYTQFVPGHVHLKNVGDIVADAVREAARPKPAPAAGPAPVARSHGHLRVVGDPEE